MAYVHIESIIRITQFQFCEDECFRLSDGIEAI
jgi:hypothetical protein